MTTYVKINDLQYHAIVRNYSRDASWDDRKSKAITIGIAYEVAADLFVDEQSWSLAYQHDPVYENGEAVMPDLIEEDCSDYSVAGPITDNRNGTVTVKMGMPTAEEINAILMGGQSRDDC